MNEPTNEFEGMLAAEAPAVVPPVATDAATPASAAPKAPKVKEPEGPNPYGIHNREGLVITMTYLRKYAQCASRGLLYNRAANIDHFMSAEFLETMRGKSTGEYSQTVAHSTLWNDPASPTPAVQPAKVKTPKPPKVPKGKKAAAATAAPAATESLEQQAAAEEAIVAGLNTPAA